MMNRLIGRLAGLAILMLMPDARALEDAQAQLQAGVARLQFLKGEWRACAVKPTKDGGWTAGSATVMDFRPTLNNLYLELETVSGRHRYRVVLSYDAAQQRYRIASYDDQSGLLDIYDGRFDDAGSLVVSNLNSGTHYAYQGIDYFNRMSFKPTPKGWAWAVDVTADKGRSWQPQLRIDATPFGGGQRDGPC